VCLFLLVYRNSKGLTVKVTWPYRLAHEGALYLSAWSVSKGTTAPPIPQGAEAQVGLVNM
jgi:hypothetical protein